MEKGWKPYYFQNDWKNWECLLWKKDNLERAWGLEIY